jgi:hypothetical protein
VPASERGETGEMGEVEGGGVSVTRQANAEMILRFQTVDPAWRSCPARPLPSGVCEAFTKLPGRIPTTVICRDGLTGDITVRFRVADSKRPLCPCGVRIIGCQSSPGRKKHPKKIK